MEVYSAMLEEFRELAKSIEYYKYTLNSLIYWDKITYMPKKGIEFRSQVMSFMADMQYKILSSDRFAACTRYFDGNKKNDALINAMVRRVKENLEPVQRIPEKEYRQYIRTIALAEQIWEEAREKNDYGRLEPYLKEIINAFKKFAMYWGYEEEPYDALLNYYVEGYNTAEIEKMVNILKPELVKLLEERKKRDQRQKEIAPIRGISKEKQEELWKLLLEEIGFDFQAGRVDIGAQATILANSPDDVRIVNYYSMEDLSVGIFNVLHSGGRGVYQQKIDKNLLGTLTAEVPSLVMEEAVGRFYENIIGKSRSFWERIFPKVIEIIPQLNEIGIEDFYRYINRLNLNSARISANEYVYLIHIIIIYEIERGLINENYATKRLNEVWNQKYNEYLGLDILSDAEGILQDIHWSAGYFAYFPTHIVANLAAAQFANTIERQFGFFEDLILEDGLEKITKWMAENIYRWGAVYSFDELVQRATGEAVHPEYYLKYLRNKLNGI